MHMIRIPDDLYDQLVSRAQAEYRSVAAQVRVTLARALAEPETPASSHPSRRDVSDDHLNDQQ